MPGVGTCDPSRNSTMMPSVKSSFLRRSGVRNARTKAASTGSSWGAARVARRHSCDPWKVNAKAQRPGHRPRCPTSRRTADRRPGRCSHERCGGTRAGLGTGRSAREGRDRAAGGLDLLLGGGRELVRLDLDLDGDLARAEHLHREAVADGTLGDEVGDGHLTTLREEQLQAIQVDDLVLRAERVLEATQLRKAHVHRHRAALETLRDLVASAGALGTTTGGLALGALTTTDAGLGGLGSGGRTQVVDLEGGLARLLGVVGHGQSTSSTDTRCVTVLTIPRISGRSSLTTTSPMRFRPRLRSVSRWFCLPPISERIWVTLRRAITHQPSRPRPWPRRDLRHGP